MANSFKVGDAVIGIAFPDEIPAKVVGVPSDQNDLDFPVVEIEYEFDGKVKNTLIHEYRIKPNGNPKTP